MPNSPLVYETHLENYKRLFGYYSEYADDETKVKVYRNASQEAQYVHSLSVFDPTRDWIAKCATISQSLSNSDARYYLQHGAGRRYSMIFSAYQSMISIVHPERTQPLSHDEQQSLSRDINIIYMNIRGVLDNLAWSLVYERQPNLITSNVLNRMQIGLFSQKYRTELDVYPTIANDIQVHDDWEKDVKERRDPVAHRIPLYVPHTIVTEDQAEQYNQYYEHFISATNTMDFEESDNALNQMHNIGTFLPCFLHHPDEAAIPIYPTIPTDLAHLVQISDIVESVLMD